VTICYSDGDFQPCLSGRVPRVPDVHHDSLPWYLYPRCIDGKVSLGCGTGGTGWALSHRDQIPLESN
jgi:hypothetical protein